MLILSSDRGNFSNTDVESFNIETCADNENVNLRPIRKNSAFFCCKLMFQKAEFEITKD